LSVRRYAEDHQPQKEGRNGVHCRFSPQSKLTVPKNRKHIRPDAKITALHQAIHSGNPSAFVVSISDAAIGQIDSQNNIILGRTPRALASRCDA
jgi:hypothetical protein